MGWVNVHAGQSNDLIVVWFWQNKLDGFVVDDVHAAFNAVDADVAVVSVFVDGVICAELNVSGGDWGTIGPVCIVTDVNGVGFAVFGNFQAVCQIVVQTAVVVFDKEFIVQRAGH